MKNKFFIYRPSLAILLNDAGVELFRTPNIFYPDRVAWYVRIDETVARIVSQYYLDIGKELPYVIQNYIDNNGGDANG